MHAYIHNIGLGQRTRQNRINAMVWCFGFDVEEGRVRMSCLISWSSIRICSAFFLPCCTSPFLCWLNRVALHILVQCKRQSRGYGVTTVFVRLCGFPLLFQSWFYYKRWLQPRWMENHTSKHLYGSVVATRSVHWHCCHCSRLAYFNDTQRQATHQGCWGNRWSKCYAHLWADCCWYCLWPWQKNVFILDLALEAKLLISLLSGKNGVTGHSWWVWYWKCIRPLCGFWCIDDIQIRD